MPFEDYASVDQEFITSEPVSEIAIVRSIIEARNEDNEESDGEDEDEPDQPAVRLSTADMQKAIDVMRTWLEMTENTSDLVPGLLKIERRVAAEECRSLFTKQQSCITSFFTSDCALDRELQ